MTDTAAEIIEQVMWDTLRANRIASAFKDGPAVGVSKGDMPLIAELTINALTAVGLAIVSVETVLALRAALVDGNADEAHRQLDALMLKEASQ